MTKISVEQKNVNEILNMHEKEKRKLEEELWFKLNTGYLIKFHFSYIFKYNKFHIIKAKYKKIVSLQQTLIFAPYSTRLYKRLNKKAKYIFDYNRRIHQIIGICTND